MSDQKISVLLALSLIASPIAGAASTSSYTNPTKTVSIVGSSQTTSQRSATRRMQYQLASVPLLQAMGTYVGELQQKWQFPSDHLPIGMTFDNLHFVSWNVLDSKYMSWVTEKNSQGLSRSMIVDEHVYIGDSKLTVRDKHIVDLIFQMISHPTMPRSILSLQECGQPFIEELRSRLPDYFEIILHHGDAVLVDRRFFEVIEQSEISGIFKDNPLRTFQDITLRRLENGQLLRFVNLHLPGDPTKPTRFEFAQYLANTFDPDLTTLAMGDMNFNELEMSDAMTQAFVDNSPFDLYSPYCTNISPYVFTSKAIDHFLVYSPNQSPVILSAPEEIIPGLDSIAALLQGRMVLFVPEQAIDPIADFAQKNCLNEGTLQKTRDYVYLKLNDEYLTQVFNKIKETNPDVRMPSFIGDIGPHISIIRHDEWKGIPPEKISAIGNKYLFTPVRVDVIETAHKRLWVLVVKPSEELAALREQYAVGDMPYGHEFHITMAQQSI